MSDPEPSRIKDEDNEEQIGWLVFIFDSSLCFDRCELSSIWMIHDRKILSK